MNAWERFLNSVKHKEIDSVPVALLGTPRFFASLAGVELFECLYNPEKLIEVELQAFKRFPEVLFIPGCWPDYGAGLFGSFGGVISWQRDTMPQVKQYVIKKDKDIETLNIPNPKEDGLMPWYLKTLKTFRERREFTDNLHFLHSNGPGELASHLWGLNNFLVNLYLKPNLANALLEKATQSIIIWLEAQKDVLSEAEGILLTDDISGLISPDIYKKFLFPYHCRIREYFKDHIMVFHCDTKSDHVIELIGQTGIDVFNIGPTTDLAQALLQIGGHCCILGNLCPVKVMQSGDHDKVKLAARECIASSKNGKGFMLSAGGGMNENTPPENIDILVEVSHTN